MKFQKWALEVKVFRINRESQKEMKRCSHSPVSTKGERERDCSVVNLSKTDRIRCLPETLHQNISLFCLRKMEACVTVRNIISLSWFHNITGLGSIIWKLFLCSVKITSQKQSVTGCLGNLTPW